jgi:HEAT repeat protein
MRLFPPSIDRLKKKGDVPGLLRYLAHKRASVRYRAFIALASDLLLSGDAVERMKSMLHDPDERVRTAATLKFAALGAPLLAENLKELISDGSKKEKIQLLKIIEGRGPDVDGAIMEAIVLALIDYKGIVRLQALKTAGATRSGHLVPNIAESLLDRHPDMRVQAAQALCCIGDEVCVDYLIGLLADPNVTVQGAARSCLSTIDSDLARRALNDAQYIRLIRGMSGREPDRRDTAKLIGDEGAREGLPLLHRACRDRYKEVRIAALRSIAHFAEPSSVDHAAKLLEDKFYDVRLEAVRALEQIGGAASLKALQRMVGDRSKPVREEAQKALAGMSRNI